MMIPDEGASSLTELADILAAGFMRLQARKSSEDCRQFGESSLHISDVQSVHAADPKRRTADV
jgi:hypothetical protein